MKKFLDILLIVLLAILVINLFGNKSDVNKIDNTANFEFVENTYTVPASV
jgi:hypothetical protein